MSLRRWWWQECRHGVANAVTSQRTQSMMQLRSCSAAFTASPQGTTACARGTHRAGRCAYCLHRAAYDTAMRHMTGTARSGLRGHRGQLPAVTANGT
jgi:hypothetical protein